MLFTVGHRPGRYLPGGVGSDGLFWCRFSQGVHGAAFTIAVLAYHAGKHLGRGEGGKFVFLARLVLHEVDYSVGHGLCSLGLC